MKRELTMARLQRFLTGFLLSMDLDRDLFLPFFPVKQIGFKGPLIRDRGLGMQLCCLTLTL